MDDILNYIIHFYFRKYLWLRLQYRIRGGNFNIDVECDTNRNAPNFINDLRKADNKLVEAEVINYEDIDFVYG